MATVITRTWLGRGISGRPIRKTSYGYTLQIDGRQVRVFKAAWTKADVSESGRFCQGAGGHPGGDRRRSVRMLTILSELWDDGLLDPGDTRNVFAIAISPL